MTYSIRHRNGGFSLLEMLVALVILAFSLGALYQAAGGATRIVRVDQEYAYATEIAQSLLAERTAVKLDASLASHGSIDDFHWQVTVDPIPQDNTARPIALQSVQVMVEWGQSLTPRRVILHSVISGEEP